MLFPEPYGAEVTVGEAATTEEPDALEPDAELELAVAVADATIDIYLSRDQNDGD